MKKSLFMVGMAALALASCTNEEVLNVADSRTISFDNAFVGNSTKTTDITTKNITEFYVFGGYGDNVFNNVFDNVRVYTEDGGTTWKYDQLQYWTAGEEYKFQAYAPKLADGVTATPSAKGVNFANFTADGDIDLLASAVKDESGDAQIAQSTPIALQFRHVLSKIKFNFTTDLANVNITISNLQVKQLPSTGNYDGTNWTVSNPDDYTLPITGTLTNTTEGITSSDITVLPQETPASVIISFDLAATGGLELTATHEVALTQATLKEGYVYTYTAKLTADNIDPENPLVPIKFGAPEVGDWTNADSSIDVPVDPIQ